MLIKRIAEIAGNKEKAKEITKKVIKRANKEGRPFGDILQEELKKVKATKC